MVVPQTTRSIKHSSKLTRNFASDPFVVDGWILPYIYAHLAHSSTNRKNPEHQANMGIIHKVMIYEI